MYVLRLRYASGSLWWSFQVAHPKPPYLLSRQRGTVRCRAAQPDVLSQALWAEVICATSRSRSYDIGPASPVIFFFPTARFPKCTWVWFNHVDEDNVLGMTWTAKEREATCLNNWGTQLSCQLGLLIFLVKECLVLVPIRKKIKIKSLLLFIQSVQG